VVDRVGDENQRSSAAATAGRGWITRGQARAEGLSVAVVAVGIAAAAASGDLLASCIMIVTVGGHALSGSV